MIHIEQDILLKNKTTFRIGGPARFYATIRSEDDIRDALRWAQENAVPVFILGKGSNILISDHGFRGLVLDLSGYDGIRWEGLAADCQAGALVNALVREAVFAGLSGLEELAGIPGSIGGALIMNAGAFSQTISDCLESVDGLHCTTLSPVRLERESITFGYRTSSLQSNTLLITGARFCFRKSQKDHLQKIYSGILHKRNENQPLDLPNCGSVFKRPAGHYAGALIEACGLKGYRIGRAMISEKHANFIVNTGNATAENVRALIAYAQEQVFKHHSIVLEPEVIFVGDFSTPLFTA